MSREREQPWLRGDTVEEPGEAARRRARRARADRVRARRRRASALLLLLAGLGAIAAVIASGGAAGRRAARAAAVAPPRSHAVAHASAARTPQATHVTPTRVARPSHPHEPSPGSLPQTMQFPSADTARFHALMGALWEGVVHNSVSVALPAFFPKDAYVQLKSIEGAASDWSNRLTGDYRLDIGAAHALLGASASSARLVRVHVVSSYGHWVPPGVCDNSIGYYETPNARVVYSENGQERSFGIASMISWRGVWYVVHLGAVLRSGESGEVDEPASGPGESAYSGTC